MNGKVLQSDDLSWKINSSLGEGGFGKVYKASSQQDGAAVAIKIIPKSKGARRELLFEDLSEASNIIEIIATGEYEGYYFIVMNLASESLRDKMQQTGIDGTESLGALRNIAEALNSIRDRVVHRDIKPDNILLMDNVWCLSDFGIARFIDQTTATETFKRAHSAPYTAPERWRGERATAASDMYSLGVTAYEILMGSLPFSPEGGDLGEKHQSSPVPSFGSDIDHRLARLVSDMLSKSPEMRPTPSRVIEIIDSISSSVSSPISEELVALQNASRSLSSLRQEEEAQAEKRRLEVTARNNFITESKLKLNNELQLLKDALTSNAAEGKVIQDPSRVFYAGASSWNFQLGNAEIVIEGVSGMDSSPFDESTRLPFDVTAYSAIKLVIDSVVVRSHSVWFSDMLNEGDYGCYEVSFMEIFTNNHSHQPFTLNPSDHSVDTVSRPVIGGYQLARNPLRIDDNQAAFVTRWVKYLVDAVENKYIRPSNMPEEKITQSPRR